MRAAGDATPKGCCFQLPLPLWLTGPLRKKEKRVGEDPSGRVLVGEASQPGKLDDYSRKNYRSFISGTLRQLMERFMKQYDKEYMKMAMLKHEKTFREQVSELHRLYRVQKMLMRDMKRNTLKWQETYEHRNNGGLHRWNVENKPVPRHPCYGRRGQERPRRALDLERPAEEYMEDDRDNVPSEVEDESEIELTLATGSRRRKKEETSYTSESGASFSSSSTESGGENPKLQDWRLFQFADVNGVFPAAKRSEKEGEFNLDTTRQEARLQQPPWLFQCLSLNMT